MQPTIPPPPSPDPLPYRGKVREFRTYSRSAGFALLIYGIFIVILGTPCLLCAGSLAIAYISPQLQKAPLLIVYFLIPITIGILNMYLGIFTLRNHRPHIWTAAIFSFIQFAFFIWSGIENILRTRSSSTPNNLAHYIIYIFPFALAALLAIILWLLIQSLRTH